MREKPILLYAATAATAGLVWAWKTSKDLGNFSDCRNEAVKGL